jgi:hypothetical protein
VYRSLRCKDLVMRLAQYPRLRELYREIAQVRDVGVKHGDDQRIWDWAKCADEK